MIRELAFIAVALASLPAPAAFAGDAGDADALRAELAAKDAEIEVLKGRVEALELGLEGLESSMSECEAVLLGGRE
jgi:hypothetical protein